MTKLTDQAELERRLQVMCTACSNMHSMHVQMCILSCVWHVLERRLQHPRQKTDHELMAARPLYAGRGEKSAVIATAAKVHGSKSSKGPGKPFL